MPLTSSIISGFIRLCFLLLFLYYLNRKFINRSESNNFLEFAVHHWFKYGSIIGIVIFVTVELNIYDLLNCVIIVLLIVMVDCIGIRNFRNLKAARAYFNTSSQQNFHKFLKHLEIGRSTLSWVGIKKKTNSLAPNGYFIFFLIAALAAITFGSRIFFFKYDQYSLSPGWLADLEKVTDFDAQIWFLNDTALGGDLAFANFYGKIANVSPEIALQSMGILEATLLTMLLFWTIRKITPSKSLAPVVAALSFALAYTLTPVNIYFILQFRPIYLALAFGLPAMVYLLRPGLLKFRMTNYFLSMMIVFITIGLVDLFTLFILFPPFIVLGAIFSRQKSKKYYWIGALGYLAGCLSVLGIYALICIYFETDFAAFIQSSLISVSSYTYIPQLLVPFNELIDVYQLATFGGMALLLVFIFFFKENWGAAFAFLVYFNMLILLSKVDSLWIDTDLLNQAISVIMPIIAGISAAIVFRLLRPVFGRFERFNPYATVALCGGLIYCAFYFQHGKIEKLTAVDTTPKQVLEAYDRISTTYFPYSYAVVNDNTAQGISTNKHFFINYNDFIYEYPKLDSIYFKNLHNPKFFKKNPDYVLPKSVLLFVFNKNKSEMYGEYGDITNDLMKQLALLKKRGRKVELFYNNKDVDVYEIINEPKESKVSDLIF
jgi:hypothetical protein